ncbi:CRISPR/Cas system CMR-associated protein Cmr1 (group 7 of RAMP superfamily) [Flavobacterium nitrogenifigens]|uniref:CRISPR/Cas system CMR-associated protein Cmr1 (Group 7 of RAMP superfamily) n=2 Tax=Flavobacterium TaxID=237 RepID=A0A7W7IWV0_9FLAO|nr:MULTISPECIES: transglycosylase domain-containing protein [Flavobacterium]MBB4802026.1 CRISPR/Cas system CMR-associated protein Cmr1 (group 7 of RAMP superfamily) [Flavobacterium nitrogenifigens]MBB6386984.1 CRISPR/Cas system CMR-associated protein Cmr1 (group 7 of RAMP superfamily) [Flavobacterium notoginsengisoli]
MFKKTLKIFFGLLIFLTILIGYLLSDFNPIYKNEEFVNLTDKIKNAQNEDFKSIIDIHNKIFKELKEPNCPCQTAVNNIGPFRHGYSITKSLYDLKIKKDFTQEECLKFVLVHYDFGYHQIGIKAASEFFFNKNIKELNEREKITLIAMLKNSSLYNPIRNKKGVKNRVYLLERILHKQNKQN